MIDPIQIAYDECRKAADQAIEQAVNQAVSALPAGTPQSLIDAAKREVRARAAKATAQSCRRGLEASFGAAAVARSIDGSGSTHPAPTTVTVTGEVPQSGVVVSLSPQLDDVAEVLGPVVVQDLRVAAPKPLLARLGANVALLGFLLLLL